MMFAIPIAPTSSATAPRPSSSVVNWPLAAARASSASDGRLTWTPSGVWGSAVGASRFRDLLDVVDVGAHVDLRRVRLGLEQPLRDRQRDERVGVERGVEQRRLEDPDHGEPRVAEVHLTWPPTGLICEDAGGLGAEHDLRVAIADHVEEVAGRHRRADHLGQVVAGRVDADAAGLDCGHERRAARSRWTPGRRPRRCRRSACGRSSRPTCPAGPRSCPRKF